VDAAAALVIDNQLIAVESQERHDRTPRSRAFPWAAIEEVLEEAGLRARHVDQVVVAGQFTPSFFLRKHPNLKRLVKDAFSPAIDAGVFVQAVLRQTGLGALEADRAAEWIENILRGKGFNPQRVHAMDTHRALAEGAYRTQDRDDLLVFSLHPMGDGSAFAVHRGTDGQLDRVFGQRGFSALHVHLQRCATAMGFEPVLQEQAMWAAAARGTPDIRLLELLSHELHAEGPRLSWRGYPLPQTRTAPVYRALAETDVETAAASVLTNLIRAVQAVVRHHVRSNEIPEVALVGSVFDNPRLCSAIADLDEVKSVWVPPSPGHGLLPIGAAAAGSGLAPRRLVSTLLGRQYHERQHERALSIAGVEGVKPADEAEALAGLLAAGQVVGRFRGRAGISRHASGARSLLARADDPAAVAHARNLVRRPEGEEPICLWLPTQNDGGVHRTEKWGDTLLSGSVAVRVDEKFAAKYPGVVLPDGLVRLMRIDAEVDPRLHALLSALSRRTGCAAIACFPLGEGDDPAVSVPGDALKLWRRADLPSLLLGPFLLQNSNG